MTNLGKGLIISGLVLVVLFAIALAAGVYWISRVGPRFLASTEEKVKEGREFGKTTDNEGCVNEALARHKTEKRGLAADLSVQFFLTSCLERSRPTPGFCSNAPGPMEFTRGAEWRKQKCIEHGSSDPYCQQAFAQVQSFCYAQMERKRTTQSNDPSE